MSQRHALRQSLCCCGAMLLASRMALSTSWLGEVSIHLGKTPPPAPVAYLLLPKQCVKYSRGGRPSGFSKHTPERSAHGCCNGQGVLPPGRSAFAARLVGDALYMYVYLSVRRSLWIIWTTLLALHRAGTIHLWHSRSIRFDLG